MQLKSRHLILFVVACAVLIFSGMPGGALLGLAALLQVALLLHPLELSRRSQLAALKLFLVSVPLFFFWGGVHSFVLIYLKERQFVFFFMALIISAALTFLVSLQTVFSYYYLAAGRYELFATLNEAFNNIRSRRAEYLRITGLVFVFSFVPWLAADWKLVFAVTATHLYLSRLRLKTAFSHL